jgi:hypothetical protein
MKLLVKFPTRQRREKFFKVLDIYYRLLADPENTYFLISCDLDDKEMNRPDVIRKLSSYKNLTYVFGNSKTKIEAVNADVEDFSQDWWWDILLLASDDMIPQVKGYDDIIRKEMEKNYRDLDGVLWFSDGFQKDKLNTLCIMGRVYYNRFHYIYNPVYVTWWCDNEFMEVASMLGKQKYFPECIIRHEHPDNIKTDYDELYRKNNVHQVDRQIFHRRKENRFYLKRLLIIQPGRYGDIIITLPIAAFYSENYIVEWLCPKEYHSLFRNIDYCRPVLQKTGSYDKMIDLSFGFGGGQQQWWNKNMDTFFSFVEAKYYLAAVNISKRWQLDWNRNFSREGKLYDLICPNDDYILVQDSTHNFSFPMSFNKKVVRFEHVEDYNVFDWYEVIRGASEIHCIDSVLSNFIEAVDDFRQIKKTIYLTKREKNYFLRSIYRNNWKVI